jgi:voltage-gated potassium channel
VLLKRQFLRITFLLFLVITAGIIGYMVIEQWSFLDALYMTIITISTVGYAEVHTPSAAGKIFSILLIVGGVGVMFYTLTAFVQYFIEGRFRGIFGRHRMKEKIAKLKGHFILCGYGRVGQEVARVFASEGISFVVIDIDQEVVNKATDDGYLSIAGDATSDEVLSDAGIQRARGLVAALGSDANNLYITLSAKGVRPDFLVIARASSEASETNLKRAGADRIILPYRIGGRRMAMLALRPLVIDFVDTTMFSQGREIVLEAIAVGPGSPMVGVTVKQGLECCGAIAILAVKKKDGQLLANPSLETSLELGDELVIIGTREQLRVVDGAV